jgi:membrane dipeptidase
MSQPHQLTRRDVIAASAGSLLAGSGNVGLPRQGPATSAQPQAHWPGYAKAIVIDALGGPGGYIPGDDGTAPLTDGMVRDARESGITAANFAVGPVGNLLNMLEKTFRWLAIVARELTARADTFLKIRSAEDLRAAKTAGKLGLILGFQDGAMLESDLTRLDMFYQFGLRVLQPTYN